MPRVRSLQGQVCGEREGGGWVRREPELRARHQHHDRGPEAVAHLWCPGCLLPALPDRICAGVEALRIQRDVRVLGIKYRYLSTPAVEVGLRLPALGCAADS